MTKPSKRKNYLKGYKVVIKQHVIDRYMERTGIGEYEARETIEVKFRNSRLTQLQKDGSERRMECGGSLNKRLIFVAKKSGKTFYVITCYLQGARDSWWKNEGLIIDQYQTEEEFEITKDNITEELKITFHEEVRNG